VRERPILFSAPMVRAIIAGTKPKTKTRRVFNARLPIDAPISFGVQPLADGKWGFFDSDGEDHVCPYGGPGDRLWVKEKWKSLAYGRGFGIELHYAADGYDPQTDYAAREKHRRVFDDAPDRSDKWRFPNGLHFGPWRNPLFMPRWASRITLEVTDVRVEWLQDIDGEDCRAEGIRISRCGCEPCRMSAAMCTADASGHIMEYAALWDSINGKRAPWTSNPRVWVVSFKQVKP
jgi:hypothetical protein